MDQDHITDLQSDFILSIRAVERDDDGELRKGEELRNKIVDLYTPSILFCQELLRHPALHQALLTLLLKREVSMPIDSTQRSVINLAQGLYVDSGTLRSPYVSFTTTSRPLRSITGTCRCLRLRAAAGAAALVAARRGPPLKPRRVVANTAAVTPTRTMYARAMATTAVLQVRATPARPGSASPRAMVTGTATWRPRRRATCP